MKVKTMLLIGLCSIVCTSLLVQTPANSNPFKKAKDALKKKPENKETKQETAKSETVKEDTTKKETGKTYKIGDTGPGGGVVFYDKGSYSEGWRYLEVAPASTEFTARWGAFKIKKGVTEKEEVLYYDDIEGIAVETIGSGKSNTEILVKKLNQLGEKGRAAQLCANLKFGGFNDWFLPDISELRLIRRNLTSKGIGDFGNNWYWSSTRARGSGPDNHWQIGSDGGYVYAWAITFSNYEQLYDGGTLKSGVLSVRAVRAF
ncbi:MAG: DUF1566 domain-containing protein [Spirochaetes bacterium]|nr:DUF1566 domain-containing protein [Spirochaetota bacterium]